MAHRYTYKQAYGPIPVGLVVRHKCDNRKCINLDHLELGTHKQNTQDALDRSRFPVGEDRAQAKLTHADVDYIQQVYVPRHPEYGTAALARFFGGHQGTVSRALNGKTYACIRKSHFNSTN